MATLCDILLAIKNRACESIVTLTNGVSGEVTPAAWADLDTDTQTTIDEIDQIHGSELPSYTPSNAGDENATVDTSRMDTEEMGEDACARATAAYKKACVDDPTDHNASSTSLYEARDVLVKLRARAEPT